MIELSERERRYAFSIWLRTGRLPRVSVVDGVELKFNPWHDPTDGRFTFAGSGRNYSRGGRTFTGGGGSFGGAGATSTEPWGDDVPERRRGSSAASSAVSRRSPASMATASQRLGGASPLHRYVRNGYEYQIDDRGRTHRVSGTLSLADRQVRSRTAQAQAGGADRRTIDDGGHYIAVRFKGPTDAFNHFAQDANFNRGRYCVLEDQWAREKRAGKSVTVKIVPIYDGVSKRPAVINIWFTINGHKESINLANEPKEKPRGK